MIQTVKREVEATGATRHGRSRRYWIMAAAMSLALLMTSAGSGQSAGNNRNIARYWKGRNISEATKKLGQPTQMTPLTETGGTLYIFAHTNEPHWVFETDAGGKIVKAAKVE